MATRYNFEVCLPTRYEMCMRCWRRAWRRARCSRCPSPSSPRRAPRTRCATSRQARSCCVLTATKSIPDVALWRMSMISTAFRKSNSVLSCACNEAGS